MTFEVFFIDWESDKELIIKNMKGAKPEKYKGAWRLFNLANQFHELETYNYFSCFFCFSFLICFWYFFDWRSYTSLSPHVEISKKSPDNFILQYFIATLILIVVGIGHIFFKYLTLLITFPKIIKFVDLCVISNISILILNDTFHGYYIHGKNPSGKSDVSLDAISEMLEEENSNKVQTRGLDSIDDKEAYEIYISDKFRDEIDNLVNLQSSNKPRRKINVTDEEYHNLKKHFEKFRRYLATVNKEERLITLGNIRKLINAEMKDKIIKITSEPSKYIQMMTRMHRFFDMPPIELTGNTREDIVMFKDQNYNFKKVFINGIEWEYFIWWVYIFLFVFLVSKSVGLGVFITVLIDYIVVTCRRYFGEKNICSKALIDDKFII